MYVRQRLQSHVLTPTSLSVGPTGRKAAVHRFAASLLPAGPPTPSVGPGSFRPVPHADHWAPMTPGPTYASNRPAVIAPIQQTIDANARTFPFI